MKPIEYCNSCTVIEDTPYQVEGTEFKGTHSGTGILRTGRVVWIRKGVEEQSQGLWTWAYAEGVGVVSIESRFLQCRPST